jgi:hypothetical protein
MRKREAQIFCIKVFGERHLSEVRVRLPFALPATSVGRVSLSLET